MDLLVPTKWVSASDLRINDIIVEMPRMGINPWRGRRLVRRVDVRSDGYTVVDLDFPSSLCLPGCDVEPQRCPHYGKGGRMTATLMSDEQEVIVIRD